jgi:hypothetical protein
VGKTKRRKNVENLKRLGKVALVLLVVVGSALSIWREWGSAIKEHVPTVVVTYNTPIPTLAGGTTTTAQRTSATTATTPTPVPSRPMRPAIASPLRIPSQFEEEWELLMEDADIIRYQEIGYMSTWVWKGYDGKSYLNSDGDPYIIWYDKHAGRDVIVMYWINMSYVAWIGTDTQTYWTNAYHDEIALGYRQKHMGAGWWYYTIVRYNKSIKTWQYLVPPSQAH